MPATDQISANSLINKLIQHAKPKMKEAAAFSLFSAFARLYYSHAPINELKKRPISELFGIVYSHWELLYRQTKPSEQIVRVFNPDIHRDGWQSSHTIVEVVMKDMPFIVDSMRNAMLQLGMMVHLMIYTGGITVIRDKGGLVTEIKPYNLSEPNSTETIEAPVYMEVDKQSDPDVLLAIETQLKTTLSDVQVAVLDWQAMRARVQESIDALSVSRAPVPPEEVKESIAFLTWLLDDQFTLLGVRDYKVVGSGDALALQLISGSGLGVLRDETHSKKHRLFSDIPEAARAMMLSSEHVLVISKTNTISTVHRLTHTDYIGIKSFDAFGKLMGERRVLGLYTSTAYSSHPKQIPFLRHKVASILKQSGFPPKSHAGKDIMHILETFPRDDLFQATNEELVEIANGILNLQDRQKVSIFVRHDPHGRYVSCLVYVPRDSYSSLFVMRAKTILMDMFHGTECNYSTYFHSPALTRIHYIIRIPFTKRRTRYKLEELETRLIAAGKSWHDGFAEVAMAHFDEEQSRKMIQHYNAAFSAGYCEAFTPEQALKDVKQIEALSKESLGMTLYRPDGASPFDIKFKLFRYHQTVPLSDALPILENMGLRVVGEQPYLLSFKSGETLWINDFSMTFSEEVSSISDQVRILFQEAFNQIWLNETENDVLNGLILEANLNWREIAMLRAYTKYLKQAGFTYSTPYICETFLKYPLIAAAFVRLFHAYFDPKLAATEQARDAIETEFQRLIDDVTLLDEDKIFRRMLALIKATLRTNFYQPDAQGKLKSMIALKFSPEKIPELPLPLPKYEIFVYSPHYEGVHLRAAKVARGGLRWSDRREDFRTEVLGLMKAQQVKNAVIVPSGAKGGFVIKNLPVDASREVAQAAAIACYKGFVGGLLDVTDNLQGTTVLRPKDVVCYDDADSYLVVAADKGTATFSDIANQIAVDRGFWLADAFASGGSTGYDHKKMGITARGAWVSAQRHFQSIGIQVDEAEITVIGIGDLAGDVFGNGVLLSSHLKLVGAFNHQHIFLDPTPDPASSFAERKRLFGLARSQWSDYAADKISKGGGVYSRQAKFITLSDEVKKLLDIGNDKLTPNELICALLKAPIDMIWNGGIGTFVKASTEDNLQAGDRANDVLRIDASTLRARVVVEGGNLGFTQLARIEYTAKGGLMNTDFIDNSAGVDCSDHEVNIKILLNTIVEAGQLSLKQRNTLLVSMTQEVAELVLNNNYHQNESVSFLTMMSPNHMNLYARYLDAQAQAHKINRALEFLPDSKTILERRSKGLGFTSPEISVLFAYSKIILKEAIAHSDLLSDPGLAHFIQYAFPAILYKKYSKPIEKHRLRHEILATQLSNFLVSRMGITFIYQMEDETAASVATIVRAFIAAYNIFHIDDMYQQIELLDYRVDMALQYQMIDEVIRLVRRATRWMLRNCRDALDYKKLMTRFEPQVKGLYQRLPKLLLGKDKDGMNERCAQLIAASVPESVALQIASARSMYHALNIVEASTSHHSDVYQVARIYFMLVDRLDLRWFRDKINDHPVTHRWSVLAKAAFKADLDWMQRELTTSVIQFSDAKSVTQRVDAWLSHHEDLIARWRLILSDLRSTELTDFSIVSVGMRELFDLTQAASKK